MSFADATGYGGTIEIVKLTFRATATAGRTGSLALALSELASATFTDLLPKTTAVSYPLTLR
jgi:hypothetical protein